ncbi:hypothetical protein [Nocardioides stalactiti]|uniref:hypothetical protein n=1 Tax=Nocardioides stalactiti TaxID=2755356 RepID=UPI001602D5A1|nr:hypothetical protein [Nocardioides stalactiti]
MSQSAPRPGQATFAAWLIIGGSVILVVSAWQRISSLHTLEVQEELQRVLSEPPVSGTGIGLEGLKTTIRVLCMMGAAAATASTILGIQALQRSTSARLALSLLAPLVLIGGFATAGFFAPLVVAGVVMLWLRPTSDWFAGRAWLPPTTASRRPDPFAPKASPEEQERASAPAPPKPAPLVPPAPPTPSVPPAPPASLLPPDDRPGPHWSAYGAAAPHPGPTRPASAPAPRRPRALVAACVTTWVSCALVSGLMVLFSLIMAVARDDFFDELERQQPGLDMQGMTQGELAAGVYVTTAFVVAWSIAATVLAVLAFRRIGWARVALLVSTGTVGLLLLAATFASPPVVVLLVAAVTAFGLLLRSDVNAWYRR